MANSTERSGTLPSGTRFEPGPGGGQTTRVIFPDGSSTIGNVDVWSSPRAFAEWADQRHSNSGATLASISPLEGGIQAYSSIPEEVNINLPENTVQGYVNYLLQGAERQVSIFKDSLMDFMIVEIDPNFNRENPMNLLNLEMLMGRISLATEIETVLRSSLSIVSPINRFIGDLQEKVFQIQGFIDSTARNLMTFVQNLTSLEWIRDSIFKGLNDLFSRAVINFPILAQIKTGIQTGIAVYEAVRNGAILDLLKNTVSTIIPIDSIISNANQILNLPANILGAVTRSVNNFASTTLGNLTGSNSSTLTGLVIDISDPFGISGRRLARSVIQPEIINGLQRTLASDLQATHVDQNTIDSVIEEISNATEIELERVFTKTNLGLPSIASCVSGVSRDTSNKTRNVILSAIESLQNRIVTQIGLKVPTDGIDPDDYLINVKKHLKSKIDAERYGITLEDLETSNKVVKNALLNQNTINNLEELRDIYARIENVFGENLEIC